MTLEEKAKIAVREIRKTRFECKKAKFIGTWRGMDVFFDDTEYPEDREFIGASGLAGVLPDGTAKFLGMEEFITPDFPEIPE